MKLHHRSEVDTIICDPSLFYIVISVITCGYCQSITSQSFLPFSRTISCPLDCSVPAAFLALHLYNPLSSGYTSSITNLAIRPSYDWRNSGERGMTAPLCSQETSSGLEPLSSHSITTLAPSQASWSPKPRANLGGSSLSGGRAGRLKVRVFREK